MLSTTARAALVRRLPLALAVALRLREAGATDETIAAALDVEPAGVEPMIELAEAKLRRLAGAEPTGR